MVHETEEVAMRMSNVNGGQLPLWLRSPRQLHIFWVLISKGSTSAPALGETCQQFSLSSNMW
jgi:hypothetical protein